MRYPKHLILDLQPTYVHTSASTWSDAYLSTSSPVVSSVQTGPLTSLAYQTSEPTGPQNRFQGKFVSGRSLTQSIFDIHFLRKEKLYTKLKYSRCPQYDIVSGGFAAIFAGFIGFLISEKFGIELVDSADFYNAFMYGVFGVFSLRPLLRVYSADNTTYHPLSPKYFFLFFRDLTTLALRPIVKIYKSLILRL